SRRLFWWVRWQRGLHSTGTTLSSPARFQTERAARSAWCSTSLAPASSLAALRRQHTPLECLRRCVDRAHGPLAVGLQEAACSGIGRGRMRTVVAGSHTSPPASCSLAFPTVWTV